MSDQISHDSQIMRPLYEIPKIDALNTFLFCKEKYIEYYRCKMHGYSRKRELKDFFVSIMDIWTSLMYDMQRLNPETYEVLKTMIETTSQKSMNEKKINEIFDRLARYVNDIGLTRLAGSDLYTSDVVAECDIVESELADEGLL